MLEHLRLARQADRYERAYRATKDPAMQAAALSFRIEARAAEAQHQRDEQARRAADARARADEEIRQARAREVAEYERAQRVFERARETTRSTEQAQADYLRAIHERNRR